MGSSSSNLGRTSQPLGYVRANLKHPLVKPGGFLFNGGSPNLPNAMTGDPVQIWNGNPLTVVVSGGFRCTRFDENIVYWPRAGDHFETEDWSGFVYLIDAVDNGNAQMLIGTSEDEATDNGWGFELEVWQNSGKIGYSWFGAGSSSYTSSIDSPYGPLSYLGFTIHADDTISVYRIDADHEMQKATSTAQTRGPHPTHNRMSFGGRKDDNAPFRLDANIICSGLFEGKWSDADHRSIAENPWQLFEPEKFIFPEAPDLKVLEL